MLGEVAGVSFAGMRYKNAQQEGKEAQKRTWQEFTV